MAGSRTCLFGLTVALLSLNSLPGHSAAAAGIPGDPTPAGAIGGLAPGLVPAFAQPNGAVTERQLAALAARVAQQMGAQTSRPVAVVHPFAPVNRLRVLVALVKLGLVGDHPVTMQMVAEKLPPDAAPIPAWGAPYVAAAIEQGWWPADRPLHPLEAATWTFVKALLVPMVSGADPGVRPASSVGAPPVSGSASPAATQSAVESYTGLVLDARGLELQRTMGPRIVDEDGQVLYPDPSHVPDMTYLQDHGMAAYVKDGQDTPRSGAHPLTVPVVSITGPGHVDLVISRETARQIRDADTRSGFLSRWAVSILISVR